MLRLCGRLRERGALQPPRRAVMEVGGGPHKQNPPGTGPLLGAAPLAPEGLCHLLGRVLWRPADLLVDGGDWCFLRWALLLVIFGVTEALQQKSGGW